MNTVYNISEFNSRKLVTEDLEEIKVIARFNRIFSKIKTGMDITNLFTDARGLRLNMTSGLSKEYEPYLYISKSARLHNGIALSDVTKINFTLLYDGLINYNNSFQSNLNWAEG